MAGAYILKGLKPMNTIELAKQAVADNVNRDQNRDYIGSSEIGHECARRVWYNFNNYTKAKIDFEGCARIVDGHLGEELMAKRLQAVEGIELIRDNKTYRLGVIKGHVDGIISGVNGDPKKQVWEHKNVNEKSFKKFQKLGNLKDWNPLYYIQAIVYMEMLGLDSHYLTVATPGGRDFDCLITPESPKQARALMQKAERIAQSEEPPAKMYNTPDYYMCKMCDFREVCHQS